MTAAPDHVALPDAPEGTCVPVVRDARRWWVRGSAGWHVVDPDTGICTCQASQFRPRRLCKHCSYLSVVITAQKALAEMSPTIVQREQVAA